MDADLSPGARLVYQYLDERARASDTCWPSQATIAGALGMSLRSVERHVAALCAAGYVRKSRRGRLGGGLMYEMAARAETHANSIPANTRQHPPNLAGTHPPTVAGHHLITESRQIEITPLPPVTVTDEQFRELEEAFDRHLKHHRTEPRDNVLRLLMDMAQRGQFAWDLFRARHAAWCASQARAGWQYCTLTFLAWIRAGMPPPPPDARTGRVVEIPKSAAIIAPGEPVYLRDCDQCGGNGCKTCNFKGFREATA